MARPSEAARFLSFGASASEDGAYLCRMARRVYTPKSRPNEGANIRLGPSYVVDHVDRPIGSYLLRKTQIGDDGTVIPGMDYCGAIVHQGMPSFGTPGQIAYQNRRGRVGGTSGFYSGAPGGDLGAWGYTPPLSKTYGTSPLIGPASESLLSINFSPSSIDASEDDIFYFSVQADYAIAGLTDITSVAVVTTGTAGFVSLAASEVGAATATLSGNTNLTATFSGFTATMPVSIYPVISNVYVGVFTQNAFYSSSNGKLMMSGVHFGQAFTNGNGSDMQVMGVLGTDLTTIYPARLAAGDNTIITMSSGISTNSIFTTRYLTNPTPVSGVRVLIDLNGAIASSSYLFAGYQRVFGTDRNLFGDIMILTSSHSTFFGSGTLRFWDPNQGEPVDISASLTGTQNANQRMFNLFSASNAYAPSDLTGSVPNNLSYVVEYIPPTGRAVTSSILHPLVTTPNIV